MLVHVTPKINGKHVVLCLRCGYWRHTTWNKNQIHHTCRHRKGIAGSVAAFVRAVIERDAKGDARTARTAVGDHLHSLIAELGLTPTASCPCEAMRQKMNAWGPAGCREHRAEILAHLRAAYDEASVATKLRAGVLSLAKGLPLTLAGLLDESIRRAENNTNERT